MSADKNLAEVLAELRKNKEFHLILNGDCSTRWEVNFVNISYFLAVGGSGRGVAVRLRNEDTAIDFSVDAIVTSKRVSADQFVICLGAKTYTLSIVIQVPLGDARLGSGF